MQQVHDLGTHLGVQVTRRLVGKEYLGVADDGAGDGDTLALTAGELCGAVLHAVRETYALYHLLGETQAFATAHATIDERYLHVVQYVERRDEMEALEHEAQRLVPQLSEFVVRQLGVNDGAAQLDGAACRFVKQAHDVQQRRFAATGRPHDAQELALLYFNVHILQSLCFHFVRTIDFVNLSQFDYSFHNVCYLNYQLSIVNYYYSSLSASVILLLIIFTAGIAVPISTVHIIIIYTHAETMRKCGQK